MACQRATRLDLAVNVPAVQLERGDFVAEIEDVLACSGMHPGALTLEITEATIMSDSEQTAARLAAIRGLGRARGDRRLWRATRR